MTRIIINVNDNTNNNNTNNNNDNINNNDNSRPPGSSRDRSDRRGDSPRRHSRKDPIIVYIIILQYIISCYITS